MINLIAKVLGLNWIAAKIDGYKTKIGAAVLMLTGLSAALAGAVGILQGLSGVHDTASLLEFAKAVPTSAPALTLGGGFAAFGEGLSQLGIGHKIEKAAQNGAESKAEAKPEPKP